jgi:hypothetical protein
MGLLAAVREWYKRDHAAEQLEWLSWLQTIEARVKGLPSVTTEYLQPEDLSNRAPRLRIHWDANQLKITGTEMIARLDAGNPRIMLDGGIGTRPDQMASSVTIMPYMMNAGEEHIIADAIYLALTVPGQYSNPVIPTGAPANVEGDWTAIIQYSRGAGEQRLSLRQSGDEITGTQKGEIYSASIKGHVHADRIELRSEMSVSGNSVSWKFKGKIDGHAMSGTVDLGEFGSATWNALRV